MKMDPNNGWVRNNIGVIYLKRNYLEEAEEEFKTAVNMAPWNKMFTENLTLARTMRAKKKPGAPAAPANPKSQVRA